MKNELEARERSLSSGIVTRNGKGPERLYVSCDYGPEYNFKEKQDKNGKFLNSTLCSRSGSVKLSCIFCEGSNHSSSRCTKVTDVKIREQCLFEKSLCHIFLSSKHKAANCKCLNM